MTFDRGYKTNEAKFFSHLIETKGMEYAETFYILVQRFKSEFDEVDYAYEKKPEAKH